MVLSKQLVPLPFAGLQTKLDPKVAPTGTYEIVDNFTMQQYPELVKRDGVSQIGVDTSPSNITTNYNYVDEVGVITTSGLYSYSPSLDSFQSKGLSSSPIISSYPVIANSYTQTNSDVSISANNIIGSVWEDSRGGIRLSIKDAISSTFVLSDTVLSATGVKPKVLAINTQILFVWIEPSTTEILIKQFNTLNSTFYDPVSISTEVASCYTYDIATCVGQLLLVVAEDNPSPDVLKGYYYNINQQAIGEPVNGQQSPTSLGFVHAGTLPPAISIAVDSRSIYFTVTVYNNSHEVWMCTYYNYFTALSSELQVNAATTDPGWAVSSCLTEDADLYVFFSSKNSQHNSFQAKLSTVNTTPTLIYNQAFILQMGVCSKALFFNDNAYVILGYDSALQSTYFGIRDDGACFARLFTQIGGGNPTKANSISAFIEAPYQENTFVVSLLKKTRIISSANSFFITTSIFTEQIYFTPADIDNQLAGNVLNIAGGYLKQYDGAETVFEQGFHLYPETPTLVQSNTADGALTVTGTYSYVLCWEWLDNFGQLHRSEPSNPASIVLTGSNDTVTVTVRTLPITNKQTRFSDTRSPVIMAVYRTESLGTVYYRVNQLENTYVYNNTTLQTLDYVDKSSDIAIATNSTLYTTGEIFNNVATPAANLLTVCKNVAVLAGIDTFPNQIFFSKPIQPGIALEFSNELSFIVDSFGGNITALATMDDKTLIFKKSLVYYISGPFPDSLGNGSFPYPLLVSSDTGCVNPQSIVLTGLGVMFQSPKGIYLIDRQLNVSYIGQQVDRITNPSEGPITITSGINLPDKNKVFFTDATNSQVLVYDTYFEQWYTQSYRFSPTSSTIFGNSVYFSSLSAVYQSIPNQPNDDAYEIQSRIKTNWISLAGIEGYKRVYAILILGDKANLSHTLNVNLYYDFQDFPTETLTITPNSLFSNPWGDGATWGSDAVWGMTDNSAIYDGTYQFIVRPKEQKCSSIQIEIFDTFPDGSRSQSFKFSGISLIAGMKQGYNKNLSYTRRLT